MNIILIPGLWLNGSCWDAVTPTLEREGHRVRALTLPGMKSKDADRSGITLADHVDAVVAAIDQADGPVLLVGHSAGSGIAHAAVDARPDRIARAVYVGGFPSPDGGPLLEGMPAEDGEVAMPDWAEVGEEANIVDFDEASLGQLYADAIPVPERVLTDPVALHDERRYDVPVTAVCPEYTAADLRGWVAAGEGPVSELARIRDVTYVDLPGGHWPQLTQPEKLARVLLDAAGGQGADASSRTDRISAERFQSAEGVPDWRVVFDGACACFATESYAAGVALIEALAPVLAEAGHHVAVELRPADVTVTVRSNPLGAITERDLALARQISRIAHDRGVTADPGCLQTVQWVIDAHVPADVMPFWQAVLGYEPCGDEDLIDPRGRGPSLWFQEMSPVRTQRNRLHVDVCVPPEEADKRIAAAVAAGGRVVYEDNAPAGVTLADPEGNEVDVATMMGRG